ncbi:protein phosphatase 1 regulatory inhibitor subunit PPP1R8 homolog [Solanum dulcamara]|uniref:protein phosphatase 1 regulatory inhibitor subunit PPP1R8 homolog n=1 Tax=Solanum dulcamara TaxID=45834 RepID=UPI00248584E8|nr:protein phosphatase 1 regulatory inhibitor subunit PPP1R8 homolog [Solanum dulcamara]
MYGRTGLDRFKKAQSLEPFAVSANSAAKSALQPTKPVTHSSSAYAQSTTSHQHAQYVNPQPALQKSVATDATASTDPTHHVTHGGGQSTWQPPDWAIEPRPGVYYLDVIKDGEVLDRINLDKRRHIFGRQFHTCDFVLDHQSVSRQHAAVVPHKNGSIYVIDLGSAHGTFVANERLTKDSPVELETGQSLKFAASTRTYILRKNNEALFPPQRQPAEIDLPPPPDPSDEEAVLAYNTFLNRYGLTRPDTLSRSTVSTSGKDANHSSERPTKRIRRRSVSFKDQVGGELVEVVGISDGVDVETEPGPVGVKEGSLVGKYESLVEITVIPKGKEQSSVKNVNVSQTGVTDKLKQVLNKVKNPPKGGIYDDLYGDSVPSKVGSWAYSGSGEAASTNDAEGHSPGSLGRISGSISSNVDDDTDDLFG